MYMNSDVWFGTNRYMEAAAMCKKIIDSGNYSIEDDYETNFNIDNQYFVISISLSVNPNLVICF